MINVEVESNKNENASSTMRRFTKKMQASGVLRRVRSRRYHTRTKSRNLRRKSALVAAEKRERYQELAKLGLLKDTKKNSR